MSDLKQRILKISNEGSPIVIFSNTSGVSLQQMPDKKWSKLTEPHKNKIRKYVATRNEKLLESASSDDLMEIESYVLKYTGKKETRSTLDNQGHVGGTSEEDEATLEAGDTFEGGASPRAGFAGATFEGGATFYSTSSFPSEIKI